MLVKHRFPVWTKDRWAFGVSHFYPLSCPVGCLVWDPNLSDYGSWFSSLESYDCRYALGPLMRSAHEWPRFDRLYRMSRARVSVGAIVGLRGRRTVEGVPSGYTVCPDIDTDYDPWAFIGRRVWLRGFGNQRRTWERYCEFRTVGVEVVGVLLASVASAARRHQVVGGDLRLYPVDHVGEEDLLARSMRTLLNFWAAVGELYDGPGSRGEDRVGAPVSR